nr:putative disease resistance rpp13-like protein 1 [Quercus suber]
MAAAILSAFIQAVLERLSTELLNYAHPKEVKKELEKWTNTLPEIKAALEDAEEKQQTERAVKRWLDDLRDFAYDLEDMLDEFATEGMLHKLKGKAKASTSKVQKLISTYITSSSPSALISNSRMGSKIKEISARYQDIMTKKSKLDLRENVDRKSYGTRGRLPPTSLVNEAHVYGKEDDKEGVLQFLFSENYSVDEVSVIPIVGDICFRMGDKLEVNNIGKFSKQVRHLSYLGGRYDGTKRVLSLSGYCITELPDSIDDLKHLRYIELSQTRIRSMPESIAFLCNLQTLILENCVYLKKLPSKFGNLVKLRHLNILKADSLEGMPPQLGTLCISRLENVTVPRDARGANLIDKPGLNELLLEWSSKIDESQDRTNELDVLNMLQPHKALKKLTIRCYGGTRFPTWLRGSSFPNMVLLRIENCKKCTSLPPVGQLPSLKVLFIKGMARVNNVGPEFYGEGCSQPFRSLETLCFENMQEWESWTPYGEFPCLRQLSITSCPKLLGKLPNQLPSLENFVINGCGQLVVSVSSFPMLCNLEIEKSKGVVQGGKVELSSLNFTFLSTMSEFTCQTEGPIQGLEKVEDLTIDNCEELVSLWSNDVGLQHLRALRVLKISTCPKLMSLVAEVEEQLQLGLPSTLREIEIINCNALVSLPKAMMYNIACLERISIDRCDSLTSFAIIQLPPTLKRLKIDRCKNMMILLDEEDINYFCSNKSLLEYLEAIECPSLKSLTSSGELPATLKQLRISSCQNFESIAKRLHDNSSLERISVSDCDNFKSLPMGIHTLSFLDEIQIWNCPSLVTLSDGGLLPTSLRVLWIFGCEDMQALPKCIHSLTSLQEFNIWDCPGIVKFPKQGFPTNITSLFICDLNISPILFKWGLDKFTSLRQLNIKGGCPNLVSFPEMMLPASLTSLTIQIFPNLKSLSSKGFQILTSLEYLSIYQCERLKSFPKDGLPPSLLELHIQRCPLLKERCKKVVGQEWSKIALIPCVQLDGRQKASSTQQDPEKVEYGRIQGQLHSLYLGIRVVIEYNKHCDCCAKDVLKRCKRFPGVSKASLDATLRLVTVIGVFDPKKLEEILWTKCSKRVKIVEEERIGGKTSKGDGGGGASSGGQKSIEAVKENKQAMEEEKKQTKKGKQVMEEGQASNGGHGNKEINNGGG